ncbi:MULTISPECIES: O-methyltransferase [Thermocrispum]|jgi:caffeoyl-CoA O-methyltransferase|uniref:O-methyltransferase n=1 Tax=Thermocrispum agreste TaxID=37925 RepID=A0A2W4JIY5_9PSEU|nr:MULTISPECIES: O-methyltransferase [Thermocrispum]PZM99202.1 MAG: O-methyltransferase [Thermocrispum agreste]
MAPRPTLNITPQLHDYVLAHSNQPDDVQRSLIEETARATGNAATMQVSVDQGVFLTLLARVMSARYAVEVGTFTGYSSLAIARGLVDGGRMLCCDVSEEWTAIARKHWELAGVSDRIELRIAPARQTLASLPRAPIIDLAFIDADKESYIDYWEELVPRMRRGGVVLADNTLWSGRVVPGADPDGNPMTEHIAAFNAHVAADTRVDVVLLTVADGLTMAVKK